MSMATSDSVWRCCCSSEVMTHQFSEGMVVFDPRTKSTCYLPGPADAVFHVLCDQPEGLAESGILAQLANRSGLEEIRAPVNPGPVSPGQLQSILVALEQQNLVSISE